MDSKTAKRLGKIASLESTHSAAVRQLMLKKRSLHPDGKFDRSGRFHLNNKCACCERIREPSRAFPHSEMVHARTASHTAMSFGVEATDLRFVAKMIEADPRYKDFGTFVQEFSLAQAREARVAIDGIVTPTGAVNASAATD